MVMYDISVYRRRYLLGCIGKAAGTGKYLIYLEKNNPHSDNFWFVK